MRDPAQSSRRGKYKILQRHFYFYLNFQKNRVGSPKNQNIKKSHLMKEMCFCVFSYYNEPHFLAVLTFESKLFSYGIGGKTFRIRIVYW